MDRDTKGIGFADVLVTAWKDAATKERQPHALLNSEAVKKTLNKRGAGICPTTLYFSDAEDAAIARDVCFQGGDSSKSKTSFK